MHTTTRLLLLATLALLACKPRGTTRGPGTDDSAADDTSDTPVASLAVSPTRLILQPGDSESLTVTGPAVADVAFTSSDTGVATVDASGLVSAIAWGTATITAAHADDTALVEVVVAEEEARAVWVTRWTYSTQAQLDAILDDCRDMHANIVYLQIRGRWDAYYDSDLEPWASGLSGTLGQDPGWDPLAYAVAGAHARGLELHAYLNTYPMWSGTSAPASVGVPHPFEQHPDWVVHDDSGTPMALNSSYVFASPGNPAVRAHVVAVATDIATRYDVDGLHFDYVRYPGSEYSHDAASEAAWGGVGDYGDWQRQQITDTLLAVRANVDVPLSAAVWGIYENSWGWSSVSQGNVSYYQDSRAFLAQGALDVNAPMIYWPVTDTPGDRLDFRTLAADHVDHSAGRHVYAGISTDLGWEAVEECILVARAVGAQGSVLFDYTDVRDNGWIDDLATGVWADPAVPPAMPWRE